MIILQSEKLYSKGFPFFKIEFANNFRTKWRKVLDAGDPYSNINFDKNTAQYNVRTDKIEY